ncbi:hypothetical protein OEA41_001537 [Lepraria neglecta]|uniref:DNA polymerase delta subunit 4 n=1 Tax=Lepraria neglecta TaxID=209136 RepID=A0AAD9ZAU9_9LECA|nr:hypothetical protein OEA41_001537 [Lepraria neglecta]
MPSTRRKPAAQSARAQQTLAFGPNSNKVTKPSIPSTSKKVDKIKLEKAVTPEFSTPSPAPEDSQEAEVQAQIPESPRTLAIRNQGGAKQADGSAVEEKAKKIPETQIRKYWKGKEDERIAPRVHQQGLSVNEKILRHFDLSSQYGVSIPRMKRWKRADGLGLKPPIEVLAVLMREEGRGNGTAERAFMDGLLTSRLAVNE